jgi:hypothetical protein
VTYVYGIMRNPDPNVVQGLEGISGSEVRLIRSGELAALASSVDAEEFGEDGLRKNLEDLQWLERIARGHNQVVEALAASASVAPLGLATIYFNDERVRATLAERTAAFVEVLERISGRAEWGVKAYVDLNNPALQARPAADVVDRESPGAAYLRELRQRREARVNAEEMALELAGEVHAELAALAHASRVHPPQNRQLASYEGLMVLNCSYLVDDAVADEFTSAVRSSADKRPALEIEPTGPWPPYSFAVLPEEEQR